MSDERVVAMLDVDMPYWFAMCIANSDVNVSTINELGVGITKLNDVLA